MRKAGERDADRDGREERGRSESSLYSLSKYTLTNILYIIMSGFEFSISGKLDRARAFKEEGNVFFKETKFKKGKKIS